MCDSVGCEDPFIIVYCPDIYKTQRMCDQTIDDCLAALNFISNQFVTSKMLRKFDKVLLAADKILVFNEDFNKVTFIANQRHILAVDLDKINLDNDKKFDEDDPDSVIHVRPLAWHSKFEKCKALKKR